MSGKAFIVALMCLVAFPMMTFADGFVVNEKADAFVVTTQLESVELDVPRLPAEVPSSSEIESVAMRHSMLYVEQDCPECEKAGYGPDGKRLSCKCGSGCRCSDGECGDAGCGSGHNSRMGAGGPVRKLIKRIFHRRGRVFGRLRGGCSSCR